MGEVIRRRIPQVTGIYLAAGWGALEFFDWMSTRFDWAPVVPGLIVALWVLLLPVVVVTTWRFAASESWSARAAEVPQRSVAVLPLENLSGDPGNDFLGDGISEEIIGALARLDGLHVASRTSSFAFRGRHGDVRRVGRDLGVGAILEGSVQRSGDRLRVNAQLIDVGTGYHLWAERYDRPMEDVFAVQDEISTRVAEALPVLLSHRSARAPRRPPAEPRAYECFLRGRYFFRKSTRRNLLFARQMFEQAIEIDPDYAEAHAALAHSVSVLSMFYPSEVADLAEAERASERAIQLSPNLAAAHAARGLVFFVQQRAADASTAFERALELDPTLFEALFFYGRTRFQAGAFEDAAALFSEAYRHSQDYNAAFFAGQSYEALGRREEAQEAYQDAEVAVARHLELNPDDARACTFRAVSLARLGKAEEGNSWAERAVASDPQDGGVQYNVACYYAVTGDRERALARLEAARDAGFGHLDWLAKDPDLASLRDEPRFQALVDVGTRTG